MAAEQFELCKIYGATPATTRATALVLGDDPNGNNFLYTCGSNVFIRNLDDPSICDVYGEHSKEATVAKYSPSGYYIASGDVTGQIRIWDTVNIEHILKAEYPVLGGKICDIAWSPDSQRIVVGGNGRERYGAAFLMDSGASVGSIDGHSNAINSVDFKQTRPFRVVTGSEDNTGNFYQGPPFKMDHSLKEHKRFVNSVRFAPDGTKFVTCSSDKRGIVYDGKTGELIGELDPANAHGGGIYACAWSPDSTQLLTASADKTAKLWDMTGETFPCIQTFSFGGTSADYQQLGCLWSGEHMLTVSLNGDINYLDAANPERPARVLKGHNKFVMAVTYDPEQNQIISGSYDGNIIAWNLDDWFMTDYQGTGHSNMVNALGIAGGNLVSGSMDDTVRFTDLNDREYALAVPVGAPVKDLAPGNNDATLAVVAVIGKVVVIRGGAVVCEVELDSPESIAMKNDDATVAVGCADGIHIFTLSGNDLTESSHLDKHRTQITALAFSPDGSLLAGVDTSRDIYVWGTDTWDDKVSGWCFHRARVNCLAWASDNVHLASGSLDENVIVWNVNEPGARITIPRANRAGVNDVTFITDTLLATAGQDCCIKTWNLTY